MHMGKGTDSGRAPRGTRRKLTTESLVGFAIFAIAVAGGIYVGITLANPHGTTTTQSAPKEYSFPTANATSTISAAVGDVFLIQLESNAGSTGFDWRVTTSGGVQYINYTSVTTTTMIGGEMRHYYFRAVTAGNQTVTLQDMRPWDPSQVAATIELRVTVTG